MRHIEDNLQMSCVRAFEYMYRDLARLLHHSPNGGKRNAKEAARFKAMGVRAGFPDLLLLYPSEDYHFLGIELKTKTGRQSQLQKEYQSLMEKVGGKYVICRSLSEFMEAINNYLDN